MSWLEGQRRATLGMPREQKTSDAALALDRAQIRGAEHVATALRSGVLSVDGAVRNLSRDGLILSPREQADCVAIRDVLLPFASGGESA